MDGNSGQPGALRPLRIGELLDRSVTLCVRNVWTFAAICAALVVIMETLQLVGLGDRTAIMSMLTDVSKKPAAGTDVFKELSKYQSFWTWYAVIVAVFFLGYPLQTSALALAASAFYLGTTIGVGEAFARALRYWLPTLALVVIYFVLGVIFYIVFATIFVIAAIALALVAGLANVAVLAYVVVFLAAAVVGIPLAILFGLAYQISFCTCVLENASVGAALRSGFSRVFGNRVGIRRSLLVGLAYFALGVGIALMSSIAQGIVVGILKSEILSAIAGGIVSIISSSFTTVFIVLYYYDLRIREEGLDLQWAARAMPVEASPAN